MSIIMQALAIESEVHIALVAKAESDNAKLQAECTIDANGQAHAPCDGWSDGNGRVYRGGEYVSEESPNAAQVTLGIWCLQSESESLIAQANALTLGDVCEFENSRAFWRKGDKIAAVTKIGIRMGKTEKTEILAQLGNGKKSLYALNESDYLIDAVINAPQIGQSVRFEKPIFEMGLYGYEITGYDSLCGKVAKLTATQCVLDNGARFKLANALKSNAIFF